MKRFHVPFTAIVALTVSIGASGATADSVTNEHWVESTVDPGIEIYVREKLPADMEPEAVDKAVLFVHGATYPGVTFDTALEDGQSWMDHALAAGYAAYYVDKRGYGESTRPDVMAEPPGENDPFATAETVIDDIDDAVTLIQERTGVEQVDLVGWSWGTVTSGMYAAHHGENVNRLVQFAPVYDSYNRAWTQGLAAEGVPYQLGDVGAYRTVTREQADERWAAQIPGEDPSEWRSPEVFERWYDAMLDMEPEEEATEVKAPNGVLVDLWNIFNRNPVYDAGDIAVPTLVIRGHADPTSTDADSQRLFEALGSETKRYISIAHGSHFLSLEKQAGQLFDETIQFLEAGRD